MGLAAESAMGTPIAGPPVQQARGNRPEYVITGFRRKMAGGTELYQPIEAPYGRPPVQGFHQEQAGVLRPLLLGNEFGEFEYQ